MAEKKSTEIVKWEDELAKYAQEVAASESVSLPVLSFRNGVMKYQDTIIPNNSLDVVVVASIFENAYYKGRFDPNNPRSPVCFALSETDDELDPHEKSADKQSKSCFGCPKAEWGSSEQGTRGKACKEIRRLGLIPASQLETPEMIAKAEIALAKLPVTSVKAWSNYVNQLASTVKRPPFAIITNIKVTPDPKTQFKVSFSPKAVLNEEAGRAVYARRGEIIDMLMNPYEPTPEAEAPELSKKM